MTTPRRMEALTGAVEVAVGAGHVCARTKTRKVYCWGENEFFQVGAAAATEDVTIPTLVPSLEADQLAAGWGFTCALVSGEVRCWGAGGDGQLGVPVGQLGQCRRGACEITPVTVQGVKGAVKIASGAAHACAIVAGGRVRCWGSNRVGQINSEGGTILPATSLESLPGVQELVLGAQGSCALVAEGRVQCWGQLAEGVKVEEEESLTGIAHLAYGRVDRCAVNAKGELRCWGGSSAMRDWNGGDQHRTRPSLIDWTLAPAPLPLSDPGPVRALGVAVSGEASCARFSDGTVRCWGSNSNAQQGPNPDPGEVCRGEYGAAVCRKRAQRVPGVVGAVQVITTTYYSCARYESGVVWCWGSLDARQLGSSAPNRSAPIGSWVLRDAVDLFVAGYRGCARRKDGTIWCWVESFAPRPMAAQTLTGFASGVFRYCEFDSASVLCSGRRFSLPRRNPNYSPHSTCPPVVACPREEEYLWDSERSPVVLPGLSGVVQIAIGGELAFARRQDGTVQAWGNCDLNEDRDRFFHPKRTKSYACEMPTQVQGLENVVDIQAGDDHFCALLADRSLRCLGLNRSGQLGDGSKRDSESARQVKGLTGVLQFALKRSHACAVTEQGAVWCWGSNRFGQLGEGTDQDRSAPTRVLFDGL